MLYSGTTCWGKVRQFWIPGTDDFINVVDYKDGVVTLGETTMDLSYYLYNITWCFNKKSGFVKELKKAFCIQEDIIIKEFKFEYKGIWLSITPEDHDSGKIIRRWYAAYEKDEVADYDKKLRKDIAEIVSKETLAFCDESAKEIYEEWVSDYTYEGRVHSVVDFAEGWAKYMQYLKREKDKSIYFIARKTFGECAFPGFKETITSSLAKDVINILIRTWEYGDDLREWSNTSTKYFCV